MQDLKPLTPVSKLLAEHYHRQLLRLPPPAQPIPEGPFSDEQECYWADLLNSVKALPEPPPPVPKPWGVVLAAGQTGYGMRLEQQGGSDMIVNIQFQPLNEVSDVVQDNRIMQLNYAGEIVAFVFYDLGYSGQPLTVMVKTDNGHATACTVNVQEVGVGSVELSSVIPD